MSHTWTYGGICPESQEKNNHIIFFKVDWFWGYIYQYTPVATPLCAVCIVLPSQYAPPPASSDLNSHPERHDDLLTLELVRNVSRGMDNLPACLGVSATFHCRVNGQTYIRLTWHYYLDLWPLTSPRTSVIYHRTSSLYQVWPSSVSFRKIWRIFRLSINRPSLVTWPLTSVCLSHASTVSKQLKILYHFFLAR